MDLEENTNQQQILKKLRDIETHFCNLISNIQFSQEFQRMQKCIEIFNDLTSTPVRLDVSSLEKISSELKIQVEQFVIQARSF